MDKAQQPINNKLATQHLGYLDSVRGIAAMMVVLFHYINWDYSSHLEVQLATFVFNGVDAVSFFFVLSGFVLSYKYLVLKHTMDIGKFYVNRFFRLWPAYFFTVVINMLYTKRDILGVDFFKELLIDNKYTFWQEALLIRPGSHDFYTPGWTLSIELIMSFFVPFVIVIAHKNVRYLWWLLGFFLLVTPGIFEKGMFFNHFVLGGIIAAFFVQIADVRFKETKVYKYRLGLLLLAVLLFSVRSIENMTSLGWFYNEIIHGYLDYEAYYFSGVASFIFLVFIIHSGTIQKILNIKPLRFVGKISYGIYLMHWLVVLFVFTNKEWLFGYFSNEKVAFLFYLFAGVIITILMATITYYFIELPFIKFGKRLSAKMKPTISIEP